MILAEIDIAVGKRIRTLPMPQAELPLAFVTITVCPLVLAVSMSLVLIPLADVAVTSDALPDAIAVLNPVRPFSIVRVAVHPCVEPLAGDSTLVILTQVLVAIAESLVAFAVALIAEPFTLVDPTDLIYANSCAMPIAIFYLTAIERLLVTLYREVCPSLQLFKAEQVSYHFIDHVLLLLCFSQVLVSVAAFLLLLGILGVLARHFNV